MNFTTVLFKVFEIRKTFSSSTMKLFEFIKFRTGSTKFTSISINQKLQSGSLSSRNLQPTSDPKKTNVYPRKNKIHRKHPPLFLISI